ncbi:MAG: tetratricopeptide repeat protein [Okeania sp. SIO3I5]|uniref:COP23 domain-containing protein n=1 Tax=Okeania sp. SIO3I5 TaxID=2607805 RepID=UPI0013BD2B96|nr:COP23 domain-containing protein [Okeania sp. SIO3I5]NEQ40526.1 tetratricopeptide repeat protein [Okeania sp. SIO3I5]
MKHITKQILWKCVFGVLSIASTIFLGEQSSQAQVSSKFYCGTDNGVPTFFYKIPGEPGIPYINFHGKNTDNKWNPQTYCEEVVRRLERFDRDGSLESLTTGTVNNMPAVCAVPRQGEECSDQNSDRVLFTLSCGGDPNEALDHLLSLVATPLKLNICPPSEPLSLLALNRLAENITVEIVTPSVTTGGGRFTAAGSGVIIGKKDAIYYVLTANHIFPDRNDYQVVVRSSKPGGEVERLKLKIQRRYPKQDLAVVTFASQEEYKVAEVGEASQLSNNSQIYVGGWPGVENRDGFQFTPAKVTNRRAGDNLTYQPTEPGEGLHKGMSGGAVLNEGGHLVGIHVGLTEGGDAEGVLISTFLREMPQDVGRVVVRGTHVVWPSRTRENQTLRNSGDSTPLVSPSRTTENQTLRNSGDSTPVASPFGIAKQLDLNALIEVKGNLDRESNVLSVDNSYYDLYAFEGKAGQKISIDMSSNQIDSYLILLNSNDQELAQDDDSGGEKNARIIITLPEDGTYKLLANSYEAGESGEYELKVQVIGIRNSGDSTPVAYSSRTRGNRTARNSGNSTPSQTQDAESHFRQGFEHHNRGEYEKAIADYNQAIRLNSKDASTYYYRGMAYYRNKNVKKAMLDLEKAAELFKQQGNQQWYQYSLDQLKKIRLGGFTQWR